MNAYQRNFRVFFRNRAAVIGATGLALIILIAFLAPVLAPHDPDRQIAEALTRSPSREFWFGTDSLGRDLFARVLYGSRVSLMVAFITTAAGLILGSGLGALAGIFGGWIDHSLMRLIDFLYTLPTLLVLIVLNVLFGEGLMGIFVALSLEATLQIARLVRGLVLQMKQWDFVTAAHALGAGRFYILRRHLVPHLTGPVLVAIAWLIPSNMMYEAFLSFIGLGIRPPLSSWGTLANEGWRGLMSYPHLILFPGLAIFVTMLLFHFVGDGLRLALDPKGAQS